LAQGTQVPQQVPTCRRSWRLSKLQQPLAATSAISRLDTLLQTHTIMQGILMRIVRVCNLTRPSASTG
jgi:hypothetical protein